MQIEAWMQGGLHLEKTNVTKAWMQGVDFIVRRPTGPRPGCNENNNAPLHFISSDTKFVLLTSKVQSWIFCVSSTCAFQAPFHFDAGRTDFIAIRPVCYDQSQYVGKINFIVRRATRIEAWMYGGLHLEKTNVTKAWMQGVHTSL